MTIREKLQKLDYSDVYDLWNLAVLHSAIPPDKWLLIYELSDYAENDAVAAKELSDDIDKLLIADKETSGVSVEVRDYDTDGSEPDILTDDDGEKYILSIY